MKASGLSDAQKAFILKQGKDGLRWRTSAARKGSAKQAISTRRSATGRCRQRRGTLDLKHPAGISAIFVHGLLAFGSDCIWPERSITVEEARIFAEKGRCFGSSRELGE